MILTVDTSTLITETHRLLQANSEKGMTNYPTRRRTGHVVYSRW
jgi:hypothetical protein